MVFVVLHQFMANNVFIQKEFIDHSDELIYN